MTESAKSSSKTIKGKHPGGRPSRYKESFAAQAYVACAKLGATNEDLGLLFGCCSRNVIDWMHDYDEFGRSVKRGRDEHDTSKVETSLLKRCLGYSYDEVRIEKVTVDLSELEEQGFRVLNGKRARTNGEDGKKRTTELKAVVLPAKKVTTITKEVQPSDMAIMFWLQNRQPDRWKNVRHVEGEIDARLSGSVKVDLGKLKKEELEELRSIISKAAKDEGSKPTGRSAQFARSRSRTSFPVSGSLR